ncbi:MAG: hypothetical protein LWW81_00610 [Rhodocyclales bacterium]|nr:hypothetical protein [Rhodocyclales bacterium]
MDQEDEEAKGIVKLTYSLSCPARPKQRPHPTPSRENSLNFLVNRKSTPKTPLLHRTTWHQTCLDCCHNTVTRGKIMNSGLTEIFLGVTAGAFGPVALMAAWEMLRSTKNKQAD